MAFKYIRERYGAPVKRGMAVRYKGATLVVNGSSGQYITATNVKGQQNRYHPYDLDYLVEGNWVKGEDLRAKYDAEWHKVNTALNSLDTAVKRMLAER